MALILLSDAIKQLQRKVAQLGDVIKRAPLKLQMNENNHLCLFHVLIGGTIQSPYHSTLI